MGNHVELTHLDDGYTLREFWEFLGRRRTLIAGCVALVTLVSVFIAFVLPQLYTAEALVILDTRKTEIAQQVSMLPNLVTGNQTDAAVVRTEFEVLTSAAFARKVIENLHLLENPIFQTEMAPPGWREELQRSISGAKKTVLSLLGHKPDVDATTPMTRAIKMFNSRLSVVSDDRSYVIKLRYQAQVPEFAAMVVNAMAQLYVSGQVETKREAAHRAGEWLREQLVILQTKLGQSESAVARFEEQYHLQTVISGNLSEQRLHELNQRMMVAADEQAQKQAILAQVEERLKSPGGAAAAAQVLASPLIQRLREQQAEAEAQVAGFKGVFANLDDRRAEARAKEIGRRIEDEVQRIVVSLRGEVSAAKTREEALQTINRLQQVELDAAEAARVQLKVLEREASATRAIYESFLLRSQQLEAAEHSQQPDARFVQAEIPSQPSSPNKPLLIGFAFFGSLFFGFALAFTIERFDESVRTPQDAERLTGLPVLGFIPRVRGRRQALAAVIDSPQSAYSDAINNLLVVLRAAQLHGQPGVIAVSSALPGEGKTLIAAAVARAAATSNMRTLLIDCDFRRPAMGRLFGGGNRTGLETMYAEKSTDLSRFIVSDKLSNLHYLPARGTSLNTQEILGSAWMAALISRARGAYDLIVLDTPPLLAVADALLVSRIADTTLLVIRWAHTPARAVSEALRFLQTHCRCPVGTVVSQVNMRVYLRYCSRDYYYIGPLRRLTGRAR